MEAQRFSYKRGISSRNLSGVVTIAMETVLNT
jgi:hypothetical protein